MCSFQASPSRCELLLLLFPDHQHHLQKRISHYCHVQKMLVGCGLEGVSKLRQSLTLWFSLVWDFEQNCKYMVRFQIAMSENPDQKVIMTV